MPCPFGAHLTSHLPPWLSSNQGEGSMFEQRKTTVLKNKHSAMLSVKYVFLIWQETNGGIVILKTVLKSDLWPGSEKCGFNPKLEDNDLKSGCYRVPKLPPLSVNYVCPISHKTNHPIRIPKIVLKSVLWRGSESALNCCIFQLLCFSLHPNGW